jgi:phasin family protein
MYQTPEQFMQISTSNLEAALSLANITLQSTERLLDLNLKTAKQALDEGLRSAKTLADAKNVQDLVSLQSTNPQPGLEKVMAYSRSVYEVATEAQARINRLMEERVTELNGRLVAAFDQAMKSAPAGSEGAFAALKSAMAAANSAYDTMSRVSRQASEVATSNITAQAAKATKKKTH